MHVQIESFIYCDDTWREEHPKSLIMASIEKDVTSIEDRIEDFLCKQALQIIFVIAAERDNSHKHLVKAIRENLKVSKPNVYTKLKELVEKGIIYKEKGSGNILRIYLTPQFRNDLLDKCSGLIQNLIMSNYRGTNRSLSKDEVELLSKLQVTLSARLIGVRTRNPQ